MICPHCNAINEDPIQVCTSCGQILNQATKEELYKAFLGSKNQEYYLRQFAKFDANNGKTTITWNWTAFFATLYWLAYRKMWGSTFIYFLLPYFFIFLLAMLGDLIRDYFLIIPCIYLLIILFVYPLKANFLYYKHCNKRIKQIISQKINLDEQKIKLLSIGGTSYAGGPIVTLAIIAFIILLLLPTSHSYTVRSMIAESLLTASSQRTTIAETYANNNKMPESYHVSSKHAESRYVSTIEWKKYDQSTGIIIITLNSNSDLKDAANTSLFLRAKGDPKTGAVNFTCRGGSIPSKYLPGSCK